MHDTAAPDTGTRWSSQTFLTQLLPGTVPVPVHVMERFDAIRAERHERLRSARHDPMDYSAVHAIRHAVAPARCQNCGHEPATEVTSDGPSRAALESAPPGEPPRPVLDPQLPVLMMTGVAEAVAGRRPVSHLARFADITVLRYLQVEAARARATRRPPTLRTVHVQHTDDRCAQIYGALLTGHRRVAYAGRLDLTAHGWRITTLRILRADAPDTSRPDHRGSSSSPRAGTRRRAAH